MFNTTNDSKIFVTVLLRLRQHIKQSRMDRNSKKKINLAKRIIVSQGEIKNTESFRLSLSFPPNWKLSLRCFNMLVAFNFFVPALLGIVFLCCKVFEIVKVGCRAFFPGCFWPCTSCSRGFFTLSRIACPSQLWIKTSDLNYSIWATPK